MKKIFLAVALAAFSISAFSQLHWQHLNGPEGGSFSWTYFDDQFAFFGDEFYLYRTGDGQSWEKLSFANIWPIATSPTKIAAMQNVGWSTSPYQKPKFLVSYDHGSTWLEGTMPPFGYSSSMAVCSQGIFCSNGSKLLAFSQDDGLTWDTLAKPQPYIYDVWAFNDRLFAGGSTAVWRLSLNGTDWEKVSPTLPPFFYINGMYADASVLMFSTEDDIWATTDGGATWLKHVYDGWHNSVLQDFVRIDQRIYKLGSFGELIWTDDFGQNWQASAADDSLRLQNIARAGNKLLATTNYQGAFRLNETTDQLEEANAGLQSASIDWIQPLGGDVWTAGGSGVSKLHLADSVWSKMPLPRPQHFYAKVIVSPTGRLVAYEPYAYTFRISTDGGATWAEINPFPGPFSFGTVENVAWLGEQLFVFSGIGNSTISSDFGQTWTEITTPAPISALPFKGKFYGTNGFEFFSSQTQGSSWSVETTPEANYILGIYTTADRLFLLTSKGSALSWKTTLIATTDGINWQHAGDGLPSAYFSPSGFDTEPYRGILLERGGQHFFYNPDIGFFTSLDTLKSWLPISGERFVHLAAADSTLFLGQYGGGLFKSGLPKNYGALSRGQVFKDDNSNGLRDAGEIAVPNARVSAFEPFAWHPYWATWTDSTGQFALGTLPGGIDTLRAKAFSKYADGVFPPFRVVSASGDGRDFGIHFQSNITDASLIGWQTRPRPGFDLTAQIFFENAGTLPISGTVGLRLDPNFEFQNASPAPSGFVGSDSLFWTVSSLELFEKGVIQILGKTKIDAPLGQPFRLAGSFSTASPDAFLSDNFFEKTDTIRGSFDPNEKRVEPADGLTRAEITAGKALFYEILFQNTGNFEADRVRITDQLDTALDWTTLRFVASSHAVTSFRLLAGGLLEVDFQGIALPDSNANEAASHGFVRFSMERKKAFAPNYAVKNTASIYFDFNDPIITNTVRTPVIEPSVAVLEPFFEKARASFLKISPNPATDFLTLETDGKLAGLGRVEFFDEAGKCVLAMLVADLAVPIRAPVSRLGAGLFFVRATAKKGGAMVGKAIVER